MKKSETVEKLLKDIIERIILLEARTPEHEKDAAQASRKASEFRNRTEESKDKAIEYLNDLKRIVDSLNDGEKDFERKKEIIQELSNSATEKSKKIDEDISILESRKETVLSYVEELEAFFENNSDIESKIQRFEDLIRLSEENFSKIEVLHKNILTRRNEITSYHREIFGYTQTDDDGEDVKVEGLRDELEKSYNSISEKVLDFSEEIDDFKKAKVGEYNEIEDYWTEKYSILEKQIQDLLPNALTAGLSHAYSAKKDAEELQMKSLSKNFRSGILGLVLVSLIPFAASMFSLLNNESFDDVVLKLPRLTLAIFPLYIPVLWIAYSANRKLNLSKRLIEEYTHKEVLSKTFEGLARQIDGIDNQKISAELKVKLLYNILEISSENPGKLISDYNKSDHPLMDALEKSSKLASAVEKLEKIPGFRKIAKHLDEKADKVLQAESEKVDNTLGQIIEENKPMDS